MQEMTYIFLLDGGGLVITGVIQCSCFGCP